MEARYNDLRPLDVLRDVYDIDQLAVGGSYIKELMRRLAKVLNVKYVLVGHAIEPERASVQTDFFWNGNSFTENFVYSLANTPCAHVINGTRVTCYYDGLQKHFPKDKLAVDWNLESYIGAPVLSADGKLSGLLVIMDEKPMRDLELFRSVIEFCAARITSEFRRMASEETLQKNNENLAKLVAERTRDLEKSLEELKETQKQLVSQEKLATMGSITLGIAHELKNPLNIIVNSSKILGENGLDISEQKKLISMISEHGLRADSIITNLLRQARQDVSAESEWHDLSKLVDHIVSLYVNSMAQISLKTQVTVRKSIASRIFIKIADPGGLERVLINIIENSIYALGEKLQKLQGSFTPTLDIDLIRQPPNSCQIIVRDNGTGIPKKIIGSICKEFYTTKPPGKGTGLGLWIAKQIIENNKGELKIKSEEGQYTEVSITLPADVRS